MKSFALFLAVVIGLVSVSLPLRSQVKPSAILQLQQMKDQNQKLIEQQEASLLKLDETLKEAQQLRIFSRRT
jgi:hypothetical protein